MVKLTPLNNAERDISIRLDKNPLRDFLARKQFNQNVDPDVPTRMLAGEIPVEGTETPGETKE